MTGADRRRRILSHDLRGVKAARLGGFWPIQATLRMGRGDNASPGAIEPAGAVPDPSRVR